MRFDDRVTGNLDTYAKQAKIIHLDIDRAEINKNVQVDVPVLGDAKETLPLITELLHEADHQEWIDSFKVYDDKEYNVVIRKEIMPENGEMTMGEVVHKVSEATNHQAIVVTDVGQNQMMAARYSKHSQTRSLITSGGLGTMGFGIPAAVGAKVGAPDRTVCLFCGDGGFQMTIQELGTIMQEKLGIKIILLNNDFLGMVRQWQEMFYGGRYASVDLQQSPDFVKLAEAFGAVGLRVQKPREVVPAIEKALATPGPVVIDFHVRAEENVFPMVPPNSGISEMVRGNEA
jgi:acetolactate synthase-1/2/3 large subunit